MKKEIWDAYNKNGEKLGFDLYRGEPIPDGVYHKIVQIYVFTKNNKLLSTQRHPDKSYPLKWECTGGSLLKGEDIKQGVIRELKEETGILINENEIEFAYAEISSEAIYNCFVTIIEDEVEIKLQEGETIDYKFVPFDEYIEFITSDNYADNICKSYIEHKNEILSAKNRLKERI